MSDDAKYPFNKRAPYKPYRAGLHGKYVQTYLDKHTANKINILTRRLQRSINDLYLEAIKDLIAKYEKEINYND